MCGEFCGIFGGFFAVVGPNLHERCLSHVVPLCLVPEIALSRTTNQCALCSNVHFSQFFPNFCVFFRGGSNMAAFRVKVDGKWQAKFQRRLRYRVTGLRSSGLPDLPFSLVLSFPPLSSTFLNFPIFSPIFSLFTLFSLPFSLFFLFYPQFSSIFPSPPLIFSFFQRFLVKATRLSVTSWPTLCPARHLPQANAACCERGFFANFSAFLGTSKK